MQKNLSEPDRFIRLAIGLVGIAMCFTWPHTIWGMLGVLPIATAVLGFCPIYRLLGVSTRKPD